MLDLKSQRGASSPPELGKEAAGVDLKISGPEILPFSVLRLATKD